MGWASQILNAVSSFRFRVSRKVVLLLGLLFFCGVLMAAAQDAPLPGLYDPVADPKAVVTVGNARFTVLPSGGAQAGLAL